MLIAAEFRMGMQMPANRQQLLLGGLDLRLELVAGEQIGHQLLRAKKSDRAWTGTGGQRRISRSHSGWR